MNPWSAGGPPSLPPPASAFVHIASTSARLSHEIPQAPSTCVALSQISFLVNVLKNDSTTSIA